MKIASDTEVSGPGNFLFVGEHAALDFANTLLAANGAPVETVNSVADLLHWLALARLISAAERKAFAEALSSPPRQEALLEHMRAFRHQWKLNLERLVNGKSITPDFVDTLNRFSRSDLSFSVVSQETGTRTFQVHREHLPLDPAKKIPALIANAIAQFLASARLEYLRHCAGADCVVYFYDTTKSHRRQWCSMAICGNRHKVARFRARNS